MGNELNGIDFRIGTDLKLFEETHQNNKSIPASVFDFIKHDEDKIITNNIELQLFNKLLYKDSNLTMPTINRDDPETIHDENTLGKNTYVKMEYRDSTHTVNYERNKQTSTQYIINGESISSDGRRYSYEDELRDTNGDNIADCRITTIKYNDDCKTVKTLTDRNLDGIYDAGTIEWDNSKSTNNQE
ncbi:MAG: hypothetical protein E7Z89_04920 [Cyanobacteria bacterium SIG28]|nr:hypothetical protein [Cyanobacteria bacterium SIG28]